MLHGTTTSYTLTDEGTRVHKKSTSMKERIRRNRGGCFCCRKRKIKCDERKPVCMKCERASYQCCWPKDGDQSLSHSTEFKLVKIGGAMKFINMAPVLEQHNHTSSPFVNVDKPVQTHTFPTPIRNLKRKIEEISDDDYTDQSDFLKEPVLDEDALIRQYIREAGQNVLTTNMRNKFGLQMNSEESFYYNAFVNGFIVSISNQLAHQKLLPGSIFIPIGIVDPLVRKLCLTCGASFLYRCSKEKDKVLMGKVQATNAVILKELISRLDTMPIMEIREWILIYFTLRNNRQKFMYEGRNSQTINLISGIQAIKLWIETKKRECMEKSRHWGSNNTGSDFAFNANSMANLNLNNGKICRIEEADEADSYILLDKLVDKTNMLKSANKEKGNKDNINTNESDNRLICQNAAHLVDMLEVESNMLISTMKGRNNNSFDYSGDASQYASEVSAFERTILETFIFNYSGTLLIIDKSLIKCVPSPFEVFDLIAPLLFVPLYNCAVPWMNNPTAGAALPMIELQAKIVWLSFKTEYTESDLKLIKTIQNIAHYYTRPIMPDEIWTSYPKNVSKKLLESCYISEIVAKGVYLFSIKILDRGLKIEEPGVQEIVNSMFKILDSISLHSQTSVVAKWAFLVIGSAIIDEDKKVKFKNRLLGFIDALKTGSLRTSLQFLEKVWLDGVGLDALFMEEYLDILAI